MQDSELIALGGEHALVIWWNWRIKRGAPCGAVPPLFACGREASIDDSPPGLREGEEFRKLAREVWAWGKQNYRHVLGFGSYTPATPHPDGCPLISLREILIEDTKSRMAMVEHMGFLQEALLQNPHVNFEEKGLPLAWHHVQPNAVERPQQSHKVKGREIWDSQWGVAMNSDNKDPFHNILHIYPKAGILCKEIPEAMLLRGWSLDGLRHYNHLLDSAFPTFSGLNRKEPTETDLLRVLGYLDSISHLVGMGLWGAVLESWLSAFAREIMQALDLNQEGEDIDQRIRTAQYALKRQLWALQTKSS